MPSDLIDWSKNSKMVFKNEIEIEYVHELKELYKRIHTWLEEHGYEDFNGQDNYETLYWQRDLPNGLQEHHIWWRAFSTPGMHGAMPQKTFTQFIKFNYQTIAASKQEVMHKGKKWKLWKSNTIMRYEGHLIFEYMDDIEKQPLLRGLKKRWHHWIYKDRWKQAEAEFIEGMVDLTNEIKAFLEISAPEPKPNIYPPNALP